MSGTLGGLRARSMTIGNRLALNVGQALCLGASCGALEQRVVFLLLLIDAVVLLNALLLLASASRRLSYPRVLEKTCARVVAGRIGEQFQCSDLRAIREQYTMTNTASGM